MDKKHFTLSFSLPLPKFTLFETIVAAEKAFIHKFETFYGNVKQGIPSFSSFFSRFSRIPRFNKRNFIRYLLPIVVLVGVIFLVKIGMNFRQTQGATLPAQTLQDEIGAPLAKLTINREFLFPILDSKGKEIARFTYKLEDAELRNEIVIQGKRKIAITGKTFLLVSLKLKNPTEQRLQINSRDYIRLSVNGNRDELLAPGVHNDPVEIQAISINYSRFGFLVNTSDKNFVLQVGEIGGVKEDIPLKFNN